MKIYKYPIPMTSKFSLSLPKDSKILTFQAQNNISCIWFSFPANTNEEIFRKFEIYGTGDDIISPYNLEYIGTVQLADGKLVWHLFEDLS
jgi:hypothetical protein